LLRGHPWMVVGYTGLSDFLQWPRSPVCPAKALWLGG
jgi:hypothetical protein